LRGYKRSGFLVKYPPRIPRKRPFSPFSPFSAIFPKTGRFGSFRGPRPVSGSQGSPWEGPRGPPEGAERVLRHTPRGGGLGVSDRHSLWEVRKPSRHPSRLRNVCETASGPIDVLLLICLDVIMLNTSCIHHLPLLRGRVGLTSTSQRVPGGFSNLPEAAVRTLRMTPLPLVWVFRPWSGERSLHRSFPTPRVPPQRGIPSPLGVPPGG